MEIRDAVLQVEAVEGRTGRRRLIVEFELDEDRGRVPSRHTASVVVCPVDLGDAPTTPAHLHVELVPAVSPTGRFRFEQVVPRSDLDVEQDWWRTGQGGEVEPIGEFVDHIHAVITIHDESGRLLAHAETPMVTASWGALGED